MSDFLDSREKKVLTELLNERKVQYINNYGPFGLMSSSDARVFTVDIIANKIIRYLTSNYGSEVEKDSLLDIKGYCKCYQNYVLELINTQYIDIEYRNKNIPAITCRNRINEFIYDKSLSYEFSKTLATAVVKHLENYGIKDTLDFFRLTFFKDLIKIKKIYTDYLTSINII